MGGAEDFVEASKTNGGGGRPWKERGAKQWKKNHPVSELMAETIEKIKEAVDANTVVGEPIVAGEITLIPVSKISLGFGTGGSEMGENPEGHGGESLGGGGAGLKVTPGVFPW